jgi:hypothetical protein
MLRKAFACFCRNDAARMPVKQLHSKLALEVANLSAERGLCDM